MSNDVTFRLEPWSYVNREIEGLMWRHWGENGQYREQVHLDINWDYYRVLDGTGYLKALCARNETGELVGYYISNAHPSPHYKTTLFGHVDSYYLVPEYRAGANGLRMMMAYEKAMRDEMKRQARKSMVLIGRGRIDTNGPRVMEACGWTPAEICYTKLLEAS